MDLKKLLSLINKVRSLVSEYKMTHAQRVFLSFGENCLTDNILERHHIKSFSTPYSSGRSNIEYILQIERARFEDFLNPEYLEYTEFDGRRVVRLRQYTQVDNTYNPWHMNGFEFIAKLRATEKYRNTPVIIVSSEPIENHIQEIEQTKITKYIQKNVFKQNELIECIEEVLNY